MGNVDVRFIIFMLVAMGYPAEPLFSQTNVVQDNGQESDQTIIFPNKSFLSVPSYVEVKGTLTADWILYKNNTYSIFCLPSNCTVSYVEQIGPNQIGEINGPIVYPVVTWNNGTVVAEDNDLCVRTTITIDRTSQTVAWIEVPINKGKEFCHWGHPFNSRTATIESPPFPQYSPASH